MILASFFKKKLLKVLGIGIIFIAFLSVILWYLIQDIGRKASFIFQYNQDFATRARLLETINELGENYQKTRAYFKRMEDSLPFVGGLMTFENAVQDIGEKHNLRQTFRFTTLFPSTETEPLSQGFSLILEGQQEPLLRWLEDFQKTLPYFIKLDRMEMIEVEATPNNYILNITGKIYIREIPGQPTN